MKKGFFTALAILAATLLTVNLSFAQTKMVWDAHGLGFEVPDNFRIEKNNYEEFTASNKNLFLSIVPVQDEKVTEDDLADALIEMAKGLDYDVVSDADALEFDYFKGFYVEGSKDGANAILLSLLDTESSTNVLCVIVYADGYRDEAIQMAASFYAYD
jgi:hypothetical protein